MMTATLPGWNPELERSFKETLFRFLEEVNSTKAAMYLLAPDGTYLLATQYGFGRRDALAVRFEQRSPLVSKARERRDRPLIINHPDECPELYDVLHAAGSHRMLLVPLYGDSQLAGFVDVRDKGRKRPFEIGDEKKARSIARDLLKLIRLTGVVEGLEPEVEEAPSSPEKTEAVRPAVEPGGGGRASGTGIFDRIGIEELWRRFREEIAGEPDLGPAALAVANDAEVGVRALVVRDEEREELAPLLHHQAEAIRSAGIDPPAPDEWTVREIVRDDRRTEIGPQIAAAAVLISGDGWAVVAGVSGGVESGAVPRVIRRLRRHAEDISQNSLARFARNRGVRRLLRPSAGQFLHLERHSLAVSRLAWSIAGKLDLSLKRRIDVALGAVVHDIGMTELDYDRLYRLKTPDSVDLQRYCDHVVEGERIVREAGLIDLVGIVKHHHERWDGRGYPDGLVGEAIPLEARIVHVAEVWDVLTSSESYRRPVPTDRAAETLRKERGRQFDPRVVDALLTVV